MSSEVLKEGDLVYSQKFNKFYVIEDVLKNTDRITYECHTHDSSIVLLTREDFIQVASYQVTTYEIDQHVYAYNGEAFEQARVISSGPKVRFIESHKEEIIDLHWIYPVDRFHPCSSLSSQSKLQSVPFVSDDSYGYESSGGIKDSDVSDSEGGHTSGYDTDASSPSEKPSIPTKVLGVFARIVALKDKEKETGIASDPEDMLQYEQLDSDDLLSGFPASDYIIETNHGRTKTGKRRGAASPGSMCKIQFNSSTWTVYGILITTTHRKKECYVEFRLSVLYTHENEVGLWCKAFKCHPKTMVAILDAPPDVKNILMHYACSFYSSRKSRVPKNMDLLGDMNANHCVWCSNVNVIMPPEKSCADPRKSVEHELDEPVFPEHKRKKCSKRVRFADEDEIIEISRRESLEFHMPFVFCESECLFGTSLNCLRGDLPDFLSRQYYMNAFMTSEIPPEVQGFLPNHPCGKEFADLACSFLLSDQVAYYSILRKRLNDEDCNFTASLLKSRGEIFAVFIEKRSKKIHLLSGQGRFFVSETAFKKSPIHSKLKKLGGALSLEGYETYVYETPEQYHNKKMKWEHSCILLYVLSQNLVKGFDSFWTVRGKEITADFHKRGSCLHNFVITDFTYRDLKVYLMNLTFAALSIASIAEEQKLSQTQALELYCRYKSLDDKYIASFVKKSLNNMEQCSVLFNEPNFLKEALCGIVDRFKRDKDSIPLTHYLAVMLEHITGSTQVSSGARLLEIGSISRDRTAIAMRLKSLVKIHYVGTL